MIFQPVLNPLILLLVVVPIAALAVWAIFKAKTPGMRVVWSLRTLLVLACFAMLLRPGIPGASSQTIATDTDIFLVVDTTSSIVAEDWGTDPKQPRLDAIREDVATIIEQYPGARYTIITFNANAKVELPLTTDTSAVMTSFKIMKPEITTSSRGTSIGIAAQTLTDTLKQAAKTNDDRARMVFYFGDGEQTTSTEPESFAAAKEFVDGGTIFGYGTAEGGPMKSRSGAFEYDEEGYIQYNGADALSVIDEANLQTIADELGVNYEKRDADTAIKLPEAPKTSTSFADSETSSAFELYPFLVAIAALILAFELARATKFMTQMRTLSLGRKGDEA